MARRGPRKDRHNPHRNENGRFTTPPSTIAEQVEHKIEKNVPLYNWREGVRSPISHVLGELEVGDSCLFSTTSMQNLRGLSTRHFGKKFAIRTMPDGYRIWRTK